MTDREAEDRLDFTMVGDLVRLITGLSSGAVILIATFLRDVFPEPTIGLVLKVALGAFVVCILSAVFWLLSAIEVIGLTTDDKGHRRVARVLLQTMLATFFIGLVLLAFFAIWNLP